MRTTFTLRFLMCVYLITLLNPSFSQISIPGQPAEMIDKMTDSTSLTLYPSIQEVASSGFQILNPLVKFSYNSIYPRGYNDGPIWKGKKSTLESHFGIHGQFGKLSYTFLPTIFYSQNKGNTIGGNEIIQYPFSNNIDWVQQYGKGSFIKFHPGQSEIKFQHNHFLAAVSTQNYSLGSSIYNPIILSRQAGGFPHLRIGMTPKNIQVGKSNIGKIEANFIFGLLDESDYFDEEEDNDRRYINMMTLGYSPGFLPQLTLGFNRVLYKQTRFFEAQDLFSTIYVFDDGVLKADTLSPNDSFDQMASITVDWNFSKVGFRAYMEFAKNDFTSDGSGLRPTLIEPEHTRAFTVGFEKEFLTEKGRQVRVGYEHTTLSANQAFLWRATPSYYTHGVNRNGYTHDGQILGGGIGPGGNSDHLSVRAVYPDFSAGILLQRIEHNRDYFARNVRDFFRHDIEYTINGWFSYEIKSFIFYYEGGISQNYNRFFVSDRLNLSSSLGVQLVLN